MGSVEAPIKTCLSGAKLLAEIGEKSEAEKLLTLAYRAVSELSPEFFPGNPFLQGELDPTPDSIIERPLGHLPLEFFVVSRALVKFLRAENRLENAKSFERTMRKLNNSRRFENPDRIAF